MRTAILTLSSLLLIGLFGALFYERAAIVEDSTEVEVVVAHYDEDLTWISESAGKPNVRYTVYSKSSNPPAGSLALPNVGRESHTFLSHIVKNYESLADWTVFTQAAAPGFGFRAFDNESGHLSSGVTWDSYLEPFPQGMDWYMVLTVATRYPEIWHSDRMDMMFETPSAKGEMCPVDDENGWGLWWASPDHPLIEMQLSQTEEHMTPVQFYNKLIAPNNDYVGFTLNYANGARFSVSRDRILMRPRSYYRNLLKELSKEVNPIEGYFMETMWYDVFHPESLQAEYGPVCDVPPLPADKALTHETMSEEANARFQATMSGEFGAKWERVRRGLKKSGPYKAPRKGKKPKKMKEKMAKGKKSKKGAAMDMDPMY